ncbi:conserved membrane protein of unknown function [Nitrosotalea devaniterrae]|uniref:Sulfatase N-terminal domain-containing protein n=1 Tax=Nitrosotalea devaniterrae TaxID=1078905 RepID=A0A128A0V2_9ARCH|nr:conserved membrane protein of unknown function [Candidatus Nitrosotalea devanaterra]
MVIISRTSVIHPLIFSVCPILIIFSQSLNLINPKEILLPILLVLSIVTAVWVLFAIILKNKKKGALVVSFGLGIFFSYGYVFNFLSDFTIGGFYLRHIYLLPVYLGFFLVLMYYFIKTKRKFDRATTIANYCSISLLVILSVVSSYNYVDRTLHPFMTLDDPTIPAPTRENPPDIYYIILDSYAHPSILKEAYNYSDDGFISFLKSRNFYVADGSHSNYRHTFLSFASSLNIEYINNRVDNSVKDTVNFHRLYKMTDDNKIMRIMKSYGYDIINFASRDGVTGNIRVADINYCEKNPYVHSQLLITAIKTSVLEPAYWKVFRAFDNQRDLCVFSELSDLNKKDTRPFFVFAHILLPHSPYRFGPNGETLMEDDQKIGYINQVKFVNKEIMEVVDKIQQGSKVQPIIIIQSDTGTSLDSNDTNEIMKRKLTILNAYYLPENGTSSLYGTITPVNSFRVILDHYFDQKYPVLEDKIYYSDYQKRLNFTDVTNILTNKTSLH